MRAVVVAHGDVDPSDATHVRGADLIVAADGGSEHLARWSIAPHVVVGDLDSIGPERAASLRHVERHPADKDKTDTELAIDRAIAGGADDIVLVGALGGPRVDHAIANTLLLALDRGPSVRIRLVRGPFVLSLLRAGERVVLDGTEGQLVSLLALGGDAHGVRTEGLRYPLRGETLRLGSSRGVSNEIASLGASVSLGSGALLVVEGGAIAGGGAPQPQP